MSRRDKFRRTPVEQVDEEVVARRQTDICKFHDAAELLILAGLSGIAVGRGSLRSRCARFKKKPLAPLPNSLFVAA
jgi:hypothetical protein